MKKYQPGAYSPHIPVYRNSMQRQDRVFHHVGYLLADREFVGQKWIGWLNDNRIRYFIRIREMMFKAMKSSGFNL